MLNDIDEAVTEQESLVQFPGNTGKLGLKLTEQKSEGFGELTVKLVIMMVLIEAAEGEFRAAALIAAAAVAFNLRVFDEPTVKFNVPEAR